MMWQNLFVLVLQSTKLKVNDGQSGCDTWVARDFLHTRVQKLRQFGKAWTHTNDYLEPAFLRNVWLVCWKKVVLLWSDTEWCRPTMHRRTMKHFSAHRVWQSSRTTTPHCQSPCWQCYLQWEQEQQVQSQNLSMPTWGSSYCTNSSTGWWPHILVHA